MNYTIGDRVFVSDWCEGVIVDIDREGLQALVEFDTGNGGGTLWFGFDELKPYITMPDPVSIRVPKTVAEIVICGAVHLRVDDIMDFVRPTPEQIKNLHDMLCIDVVLHED